MQYDAENNLIPGNPELKPVKYIPPMLFKETDDLDFLVEPEGKIIWDTKQTGIVNE